MNWKTLVILILVMLAAFAASAEVEVTIGYEALELGNGGDSALDPATGVSAQRDGTVTSKKSAEAIAGSYAVPHFRIDIVNTFGDTTLMAVRNELPQANPVQVEIFDAPHNNRILLSRLLAGKEVWTINLRDVTVGIPDDADGYRRGEVLATSTILERISLDWFQVNPDEDFAVGGTGINFNQDFCNSWRIRSLVGGGFSGGTTVIFNLNSNQCTVSGNVYTEAGSLANVFSFPTGDDLTLTVNASTLTSINASTMDIDLSNCQGGWVGVVHDAEGRYSVGVDGICTD